MVNSLVSIVIPVYNVELYLLECVESVEKQSYSNMEIILVDDGSTDNSGLMCDKMAAQDSRIRVIHKKNGGLSSARNAGMQKAKGEYIYFLDSDDYINADTIETLVLVAQNEEADIIFFEAEPFYDGLSAEGKKNQYRRSSIYPNCNGVEMLGRLLQNDEFIPAVPLFFYKRNYLLVNGIVFREGILHEDELFSFYVYMANGKSVQLTNPFYNRRFREGSIITSSNLTRRYNNTLDVYNEILDINYDQDLCEKVKDRYLSRLAFLVIRRYKQLQNKEKKPVELSYRTFIKTVKRAGYYGSLGLKLNCCNSFMRMFYMGEYRLKSIIKQVLVRGRK